MSLAQTQDRLRLPETLHAQLHDFRRRVWSIKMIEAIGGEGSELGKNSNEKTGIQSPAEAERQLSELAKKQTELTTQHAPKPGEAPPPGR